MIKTIARGLLGRLLAYAVFGLGFWLLFQGFLRPSIPLGLLGSVLIPLGMYLMVTARRNSGLAVTTHDFNDQEEDKPQ